MNIFPRGRDVALRGCSRFLRYFLAALLLLLPVVQARAEKKRLRIGHFPNMTHVQALVAHNLSRQGKGWFEQRLGPDVEVEWYLYNAGPSAMEAFFARSIDMTYVGPSPAVNAYVRSRGGEVRIVAGAVNGGSALVIQPGLEIKSPADFRGKKIATPQLGNTQDVACRAFLNAHGVKVTQSGGDAFVLPASNPDLLALFAKREVDAAWTIEPWVTRLIQEAGGKIYLEEKDAVTTVLVSSARFLRDQRELLQKVVAAHRELTEWIIANPEEAQRIVVEELAAETRTKISAELVASAWPRLVLTNEVSRKALETYVENAKEAGFLRRVPDLGNLVVEP